MKTEMAEAIIDRQISRRILMTGVYYRNNHPGGISSVIRYWADYIDDLQFYPTFKEGSAIVKVLVFVVSFLRLFFRLLFDRHVEIVHVHTAADLDFWRAAKILGLAKTFKKKVILHSHASRFKDYYAESPEDKKRWIVQTLCQADVLIALSDSWKQWFAGIGVEESRIRVLHNITPYPEFKPAQQDGKTHFLFLGEIGQRKGVFDVIRALAVHREELGDRIELRIGGNKHENELRQAIAQGGLSGSVRFEGFVSGEEKIALLNWGDVFLLPSYNEGLPISILEAMSYKMPIISTPVGGIPEVLDAQNGILVTPGDTESIFQAMLFYVEHRDQIARQGESSYRKAEAYFPAVVLNDLKRIYESLLEK